MYQARRSERIRTKHTSSSEEVHGSSTPAAATDEQDIQNSYVSDLDETLSPSSSSEDENDDDDYPEPGSKRRKSTKRARSTATKRARKNVASKKDREQFLQVLKEFVPTELFEILGTSEDVSIEELLRSWLGTYQTDRDAFLQQFINLLLCCCGMIARVEEHDVHSNESSNETISEVQLLFQQQKIHEFHLLVSKNNKKRSKYKHLYSNFLEFMSKLINIANDLQLLYVESPENGTEIVTGPIVLDLLTWLSSMSVCKIRSLRYVSTLTLYLFQDSLTEFIVDLERNYMAKLSKQLALEKKKKRPNKKTLDKLESTLQEVQSNKTVAEGIVENIIQLCFVHRFKDVDPSIRSESILHLSIWIENYPEFFLKVTFLKYFGWLLSDSSTEVRLQVLRILPGLISGNKRKNVDNSAVRQFCERFKDRILEISLKDVDLEVRVGAVNALAEMNSMGYLEDEENLAISSLMFREERIKVTSHSKSSKLLSSVAKFFARLIAEKCEEFISTHEIDETLFEMKSSSVIKLGIFASLLSKSLAYKLQESENIMSASDKTSSIFQAAEFLYPYFGSTLEDICHLLVYHGSFTIPFMTSKEESLDNDATDLLLPNDKENTVLYATILNGFCQGGAFTSGQPRLKVAEAVLPHMEKLVNYLPIQSSIILCPILEIFNIFSFEDWIYTGYEKSLKKVAEIVIKPLVELPLLANKSNETYKAYDHTIDHLKKLKLSEVDQFLLNQISHLKLHLSKFLKEKMPSDDYTNESGDDINALINTLHGMFINKISLLGKYYPIEFDTDLLQEYFDKFLSKLSIFINICDTETLQGVNLKFLTLIVSWTLQKWTELIGTSNTEETTSNGPNNAIKTMASIVERLNTTLITLSATSETASYSSTDSIASHQLAVFSVLWTITNPLVDTVIALKVFELGLPERELSWKYGMKDNFPYYLNEHCFNALKTTYLFLESICAKHLGVQLDRLAGEDVNLNDLPDEQVFPDPERELLLFTIKLKSLIKLELLHGDLTKRIALNKEVLGHLYKEVIDDTIFQQQQQQQHLQKMQPRVQVQPTKHIMTSSPEIRPVDPSDDADDQLEPIEEHSHEETPDIEML